MNDYVAQTEKIIGEIKEIDKKVKGELRDKILKLASHIEKGIEQQRPEILTKAKLVRGSDEISAKLVSKIIKRIRDEHFASISIDYITKVLPSKYKEDRPEVEKKEEGPENLIDFVTKHKDEVKEVLKKMDRGPSKEPRFKDNNLEEAEKYTFDCHLAQEILKLAIKMEKEHKHKHDDGMCKEYCKRVKTVRDKRFATPINHYEGILVALAAGASISEVAKGEWEHIDPWKKRENEKNCNQCFSFVECESTKCNCKCHRTVVPMTTKGVKFGINHDDYLKSLDKELREMMVMKDELCRKGRLILKNKTASKYLNNKDKERVIMKHIENDDCLECDLYITKHPLNDNED